MALVCKTCNKTFRLEKNLKRHMKTIHNQVSPNISLKGRSNMYKCLQCPCSYNLSRDLRYHLQNSHGMPVDTEEWHFESVADFSYWKLETERKEKCYYVASRTKWRNYSRELVTEYICNKSDVYLRSKIQNEGEFKLKSHRLNLRSKIQNEGEFKVKSQGLCKLNGACISQIKAVTDTSGNISVVRVKSHYGHATEIKQEQTSIASELICSASKLKVFETKGNKIGTETNRIDLQTKKDISNIQQSFELNISEESEHENDAIRVDFWIKETKLHLNEDSPVLFYKKQDKKMDKFNLSDFCIILMNHYQQKMLLEFGNNIVCIDSTYGLNNYDFEMTTLMVVDDFHESFPVAYMFTNRSDIQIQKIFFDTIKSKVGVITSKTFMADETNLFYNAWSSVMGPVSQQLYGEWYVYRSWQSNLTKIIPKVKRDSIYSTLKSLQNILDSDAFNENLEKTELTLLEDDDTYNFGIYFNNYYSPNCKQWATCYREEYGIDANTRIQSLHEVVEYFHSDKKQVKKLYKALHAVLQYTRDKTVNRIMKLDKEQYAHYKDIVDRHKDALSSTFNAEIRGSTMWKVVCEKVEHIVQKVLMSQCCKLICEFCQICVHMYQCNCSDYLIKCSICKHIHFVGQLNKVEQMNYERKLVSKNYTFQSKCNEIDQCHAPIVSKSNLKEKLSPIDRIGDLKEEIQLRINNMSSELDNKSETTLNQINSLLKTAECLTEEQSMKQEIIIVLLKKT